MFVFREREREQAGKCIAVAETAVQPQHCVLRRSRAHSQALFTAEKTPAKVLSPPTSTASVPLERRSPTHKYAITALLLFTKPSISKWPKPSLIYSQLLLAN